jgi:hypothetical protein
MSWRRGEISLVPASRLDFGFDEIDDLGQAELIEEFDGKYLREVWEGKINEG